jgi:predicted nucleic acid-binding protein
LDYLGITGKGNITNKANQIITHLASCEDVVEPDTVALRCLKKWFMKPLEGPKIQGIFRKVKINFHRAQSQCFSFINRHLATQAHQMEPVLLRLLNDFLASYSDVPGFGVQSTVRDIVLCGLLESTNNKILCGSPDGVCFFTMHDATTHMEGISVRAAIEMKYLSSSSTSAVHRDLLAEGEVARFEVVHVTDVGNKDFYRSVRNVAHRGQCLYHCIVLGVEWCLYVTGDDERIARVVAIHFDVKVRYVAYVLVFINIKSYILQC